MPSHRRRAEAEFKREFRHCRPWLVGALVEAAATALARLPLLRSPKLPRLADFSQWAVAAEPAFGCAPGTFGRVYRQHGLAIDQFALETSPLAQPLVRLLGRGAWRGTVTELQTALDTEATAAQRRLPGWPTTASKLSNALRRLVPNLRAVGVAVEFTRGSGSDRRRLVSLRRE